MRPNTVHFVLTVEDSIVYGRHFYSKAAMQATVFGIVHTFVMSYTLTNALHDELDTMLRRMMVMWSAHHFQPVYSKLSNPHIPKATTPSGLMDIIALGNLLEFSQVLDRRSYYTADGIHWQEQHEIAMARQCYRWFQSWFVAKHDTTVGGKRISALCIFHRCLVEFAAAIIVYKRAEWAKTPRRGLLRKCTAEIVQEKIVHVFDLNFPELLPCLRKLVEDKAEFLYWTGPPLSIHYNGGQRTDPQLRDFEDRPIYLEDADEGMGNGDGNSKGKEKETVSNNLLRDGDQNGNMFGGLLHIFTLLTTQSVFKVPGITPPVKDCDMPMVQDDVKTQKGFPQSRNTGELLCICTIFGTQSASIFTLPGITAITENPDVPMEEAKQSPQFDNTQAGECLCV
jgi:hypothetical protein